MTTTSGIHRCRCVQCGGSTLATSPLGTVLPRVAVRSRGTRHQLKCIAHAAPKGTMGILCSLAKKMTRSAPTRIFEARNDWAATSTLLRGVAAMTMADGATLTPVAW
ncbi:hypothetical protein IG631_22886 [Alternaria alternata]|nr:hypothetical protein IG631_22886 [Alternaria alternata]